MLFKNNIKCFFECIFYNFGRGSTPDSRLLSYIGILLILLLVGGREVSKIKVFESLYLIDISFVILTISILIRTRFKLMSPIFLLAFISIFANLIVSYFISSAPIEIIIRQFVLFVYPFSCYVIVINLIHKYKIEELYRIIIGTAALSVVFQLFFLVYLIFTGSFDIAGFNYLSPLVVCGFIVWACYIFVLNGFSALPQWFMLLVISLTFGHASAVLAIGLTPFLYLLFKSKIINRISILLLIIGLFYTVFVSYPGLVDMNASWRLSYWGDALDRLSLSYNWVFGFGFGELYANDNTRFIFTDLFGHDNDLSVVNEGYYKAFHNSYITIFFHIGIIGIVFLLPQIRALFITRSCYQNELFLVSTMAVFSLSVWVSLNVILELPHSAHYFWFLFYICFYLQQSVKSQARLFRF